MLVTTCGSEVKVRKVSCQRTSHKGQTTLSCFRGTFIGSGGPFEFERTVGPKDSRGLRPRGVGVGDLKLKV